MTIEELAAKIDQKFDGVDQKFDGIYQRFDGIDQKFDGIDQKFAGIDRKFAGIDQRFDGIDQKSAGIDQKLAGIDSRFDTLEKKVEEGFDASRARDEDLRGLMKFGLEAHEVLREETHRRFDETDRKHDQQITLLQDAVRHLGSHP